MSARRREVVGFLGVGTVAFAVQFGLLNLLVAAGLAPLPANAVAIVVSVAVAYAGNRQVSFAHRRRADVHREAIAFVVVNAVTLGLSEALIALAYLVHDQHDRVVLDVLDLAGLGLGTLLRYWAYRRYVFTAGDTACPPNRPLSPVGGNEMVSARVRPDS